MNRRFSIAHIFPLPRKSREEKIATHPGNRARTLLFPLSLLALALVFTFVSLVPAFAQPDEEKSLAPSNLSVSLVDNKVTLTWDAPSADADSVTGYQILRRNPKVDDKGVFPTVENNTESTSTNHVDTTVEAGGKYFYRVKAWRGTELSGMSKFSKIKLPDDYDPDQAGSEGSDSGGSGSDQQDPTPTPTPAPEPQTDPADLAPTNLSVTLASEGGLYLDWDAPTAEASNVTGYVISRSVGTGHLETLVSDTQSTATDYTDSSATVAGETYGYQVKAIRNGVESLGSNVAAAQLPDPAALAPSNLTAEAVFRGVLMTPMYGGVELQWDAPVEKSSEVTGYAISRSVGGGALSSLVTDTASTLTEYTDASATTLGETYAYVVFALRGTETSQASNQAEVQIQFDPADLAPTNLAAEIVEAGISLSWSAPAEDTDSITQYRIERVMVPDDETEIRTAHLVLTGSTSTQWLDTRQSGPGPAKHTYEVVALRGAGTSEPSNSVEIDVDNPTREELAPSDLTASVEEDDEGEVTGITLSWSAPVEDAGSVTGYEIERTAPTTAGDGQPAVVSTGSTGTTWSDGELDTDDHGTYSYRVRAIRDTERSDFSGTAEAEILAEVSHATVALWSGTITAECESTPAGKMCGYWTSDDNTRGSISNDTFNWRGAEYTVNNVFLRSDGLHISISFIDDPERNDITLAVDDHTTLRASNASYMSPIYRLICTKVGHVRTCVPGTKKWTITVIQWGGAKADFRWSDGQVVNLVLGMND